MPTNPYEPPQQVNEPRRAALTPWHVLRETLSAFGCLGAAILAILAAFVVVWVLGWGLGILLEPFMLKAE
jgi:hypothetical protein